MKLIKVTWRDAQHHDGSVPDYLKSMDCICETIGFLVDEDPVYLTIARDRYEHSCWNYRTVTEDMTEEFSSFIRIPKHVILEQEKL